MKVAIIIGHNSYDQGARAIIPLLGSTILTSEFDFNTIIAALLEHQLQQTSRIHAAIFTRVSLATYAQEIDECYRRVNAFAPDLSVELHFNAAAQHATGSETFHSWSKESELLARHVQAQIVDHLGLPNRGIKLLRNEDRGGRSLYAGKAPAILVEPFFGSNRADCQRVNETGRATYAHMLTKGIIAYAQNIGLLPQAEDRPAPLPAPAPNPKPAIALAPAREALEEIQQDAELLLTKVQKLLTKLQSQIPS